MIDLLNCHRLRFYNLKTYHNEQVNISWIKKNLFQLTLLLSSPPYIKCSKPNLQLIMIWRINNIVVQNLQSSLVLFYCLLFFSFLFCALLLFLYTLNHSLYVVDLYSVTSLLIKYPYIYNTCTLKKTTWNITIRNLDHTALSINVKRKVPSHCNIVISYTFMNYMHMMKRKTVHHVH